MTRAYTQSPKRLAKLAERRKKVRDLLRAGVSGKEIAALLGVTDRTISRDREKLGMQRFRYSPISVEERARIEAMLDDGVPLREIGRTLGRDPNHLCRLYRGRSTYRGDSLRSVTHLRERLGLTG